MTQRQLAEQLQVSRQSVAGYEAGFRRPSIKTAKRIIDFARGVSFDIDLCDLF